MSEPLLLIGAGGHARSLIEVVESSNKWHIVGLVGLLEQVGDKLLGYPVLGSDSDLIQLRQRCANALLAIGQISTFTIRQRLVRELRDLNFSMPTVISANAIVSGHAEIGIGTSVGHGVIVNAGACVGEYCILNSNSLIEHDVIIGNYCHISTGALINGGVNIGSGSFIGSGALLREGLTLPANSIVSAGKRVMGWPLREEQAE